jgi:hypothetical protein
VNQLGANTILFSRSLHDRLFVLIEPPVWDEEKPIAFARDVTNF